MEGDALACTTSLPLERNKRYSNYEDCEIGKLLLNTFIREKMIASGQSLNNLEQIVSESFLGNV